LSEENQPIEQNENHVILERREKLKKIREAGVAFPNDFKPQHFAKTIHEEFGALENDALEPKAIEVTVAGRMMLKRVMGKASFATLQDGSGRIQLFISKENIKNDVAETIYENFKHWDLGDILGATGVLFKTKTGELSIRVSLSLIHI
jgi:lysyl-tRNA synthetase class 2